MRGVFITGTDTGVGKTVAAAALMHRYRGSLSRSDAAPVSLRYWKPIQTGIEDDDDTAVVRRLGACRGDEVLDAGVRLRRPLSPHLAARLAGMQIAVADILAIAAAQAASDRWIVEGAGGILVPVNDSEVMADVVIGLGLPVVIVARTTLGTINHTLLTIEALRRRRLAVAGVLLVGPRDDENRRAIEEYGGVPVIGRLPLVAPITAEALAQSAASAVDTAGRLLELFR